MELIWYVVPCALLQAKMMSAKKRVYRQWQSAETINRKFHTFHFVEAGERVNTDDI